ncbi:MAG: phage tail tape measure protein [Candidatus Dormibacteraceae bacterium]
MSRELPPLVGILRGNVSHFVASMGKANAEAHAMSSRSGAAFHTLSAVGKVAFLGIAGAAIAGGAVAVKMAGDFQQSMTQLVTGAGESKANIGLVSKGILDMAGQVGVSAQDIASGMYTVESAGYHGAAGLTVMRTAAEGAKVGGADMATVADALTTALNAYHQPASQATAITNDLVATVASGKMHMQDLASSLGTVLPAASTAKVSLAEISGAMATMTMQGTPAADAATYLRQTILQMENPSAKAQKALKDVGLGARQLATDLGTKGLAATLQEATDAIGKKFTPGSSEYISHLADMVGGTKSMQAALELTGGNMATFRANTASITDAVKQGGNQVAGWGDTQKDFNFQVDQAKAATGALGIQIGLVLIPYVEKAAHVGIQFANYLMKHKDQALMLGAAVGGPLVIAIGAYTVSMIAAAAATIAATWEVLAVIAAIALLSAGVVYAYTHWGWFRNAVNAVAAAIIPFGKWLGTELVASWKQVSTEVVYLWGRLQDFGSWVSNTFGPILKGMGGALSTAGGFLNAINPWAKHSPSLVENVLSGTTAIAGHYQTMSRSVQSSMGGLGGTIAGVGSAASTMGATSGGGSEIVSLLKQLIQNTTPGSSSRQAVVLRIGDKDFAGFLDGKVGMILAGG